MIYPRKEIEHKNPLQRPSQVIELSLVIFAELVKKYKTRHKGADKRAQDISA